MEPTSGLIVVFRSPCDGALALDVGGRVRTVSQSVEKIADDGFDYV